MHIKPLMGFKNKTQRYVFVFGLIVSVLAVFFSLKGIDWKGVPDAFSRVRLLSLVGLVPVFYAMFLIRAWRWQLLLPAVGLKQSFDATMLGFFASSVLPLRAGEFIRPWALSSWSGIAVLTCFASVVVERVFDILALLFMLSVSLSLIELPTNLSIIFAGAKALLIIASTISILMILIYLRPNWIEKLVEIFCKIALEKRFPVLAQKLKKLSSDFIIGFRVINSPSHLVKVILSSILLWIVMSFYYQIAIWSFNSEASLVTGPMVTSMIALAVAAPSAPGFIGTFQLGCVLALSNIFAYSKEVAIAYSIIVHLSQYILTLGHGFYILNKQGLKLSELGK